MICPKCQKDLPDNPTRCSCCGHEFRLESDAVSPARDATRPFQTLEEAPPTKIAQMESDTAATKIASAREAAGITKVHMEPSITPTKVAITQPLEPTKVFGEARNLKPIYGWLVVLEGKQQWSQFIISQDEGRCIIGCTEDCGFILNDQDVEPHHASLRLKEGKLQLTDLDTASGTRVKGQEISRVELQDGDEIQIGSALLKFRRL